MKNRPYETLPVATKALAGSRSSFEEDYTRTITWCLDNVWVEENPMAFAGTPPQEFGLPDDEFEGIPVTKERRIDHALWYVGEMLADFETVYKLLSDDESKDVFLTTLAYRGLGWRYVTLPLDTSGFRSAVAELLEAGEQAPETSKIKTQDGFATLSPISLKKYGYDIDMLHENWGVFSEIIYSQYEYRSQDGVLKLQEGDVVLDCGACWGGTSLYFGEQVGPSGKVVSFEFVPSNVEIFKKNMALNPRLSARNTLVQSPVWSEDNVVMTAFGTGPATRMEILENKVRWKNRIKGIFREKYRDPDRVGRYSVKAGKIDTFASRLPEGKVDFIKMDIEGAELRALQGAQDTIRKHKPTLAVCVYHDLKDYTELALYISKLNPNYKFYFGHNTIQSQETILFATERDLVRPGLPG